MAPTLLEWRDHNQKGHSNINEERDSRNGTQPDASRIQENLCNNPEQLLLGRHEQTLQ
jgi:hypothetical protein